MLRPTISIRVPDDAETLATPRNSSLTDIGSPRRRVQHPVENKFFRFGGGADRKPAVIRQDTSQKSARKQRMFPQLSFVIPLSDETEKEQQTAEPSPSSPRRRGALSPPPNPPTLGSDPAQEEGHRYMSASRTTAPSYSTVGMPSLYNSMATAAPSRSAVSNDAAAYAAHLRDAQLISRPARMYDFLLRNEVDALMEEWDTTMLMEEADSLYRKALPPAPPLIESPVGRSTEASPRSPPALRELSPLSLVDQPILDYRFAAGVFVDPNFKPKPFMLGDLPPSTAIMHAKTIASPPNQSKDDGSSPLASARGVGRGGVIGLPSFFPPGASMSSINGGGLQRSGMGGSLTELGTSFSMSGYHAMEDYNTGIPADLVTCQDFGMEEIEDGANGEGVEQYTQYKVDLLSRRMGALARRVRLGFRVTYQTYADPGDPQETAWSSPRSMQLPSTTLGNGGVEPAKEKCWSPMGPERRGSLLSSGVGASASPSKRRTSRQGRRSSIDSSQKNAGSRRKLSLSSSANSENNHRAWFQHEVEWLYEIPAVLPVKMRVPQTVVGPTADNMPVHSPPTTMASDPFLPTSSHISPRVQRMKARGASLSPRKIMFEGVRSDQSTLPPLGSTASFAFSPTSSSMPGDSILIRSAPTSTRKTKGLGGGFLQSGIPVEQVIPPTTTTVVPYTDGFLRLMGILHYTPPEKIHEYVVQYLHKTRCTALKELRMSNWDGEGGMESAG